MEDNQRWIPRLKETYSGCPNRVEQQGGVMTGSTLAVLRSLDKQARVSRGIHGQDDGSAEA